MGKNERHWRNVHFIRQRDEDYFCAQVCTRPPTGYAATACMKTYLHLDIFDPHEPWDPPKISSNSLTRVAMISKGSEPPALCAVARPL